MKSGSGISGCRRSTPESFTLILKNTARGWSLTRCSASSPCRKPGKSLAEQYTNYTYPYSINERLADIKTEIKKRHIDGVIHYVQAFCHRGIGDIVMRSAIDLPVLTLEGNADFYLNGHVKTRIEAFLDMIERKKQFKMVK